METKQSICSPSVVSLMQPDLTVYLGSASPGVRAPGFCCRAVCILSVMAPAMAPQDCSLIGS